MKERNTWSAQHYWPWHDRLHCGHTAPIRISAWEPPWLRVAGPMWGVNIEISSYGLALCAERSALAAALSDGARPTTHIAVACIDAPPDAPLHEHTPCGACRQWIADLAPEAVIFDL